MTQQLTKMEIDRVDLVDAGANGRRFALFKRDDGAPLDAADGWGAKLSHAIGSAVAKALGIPEPVDKAMTFAQIVAGREMTDALEEHWTTLQDALWSALYAYDDDGNALSLDAKKALVAQNLDEFKTFLLDRMDQGVSKQDGPAEPRLIAALVAKVGRKVSAARLVRLKEAADALTAVLAEVEADDESAEAKKRATAQHEETDPMTPEELSAAIAKGNEPLVARIEALEKAAAPESDEVTLETVAESITKLADRVAAVETSPGTRQSAPADEATPVKKSKWAGVLD